MNFPITSGDLSITNVLRKRGIEVVHFNNDLTTKEIVTIKNKPSEPYRDPRVQVCYLDLKTVNFKSKTLEWILNEDPEPFKF